MLSLMASSILRISLAQRCGVVSRFIFGYPLLRQEAGTGQGNIRFLIQFADRRRVNPDAADSDILSVGKMGRDEIEQTDRIFVFVIIDQIRTFYFAPCESGSIGYRSVPHVSLSASQPVECGYKQLMKR